MKKILAYYRLLNILSIDVAAGAVCCSLFFNKYFDTPLIAMGQVVLGLSVWLIYTVDHLFDAASIQGKPETIRHDFHQRFYKILKRLVCVVAAVAIGMLFFLPYAMLVAGGIVGTLALIYLNFSVRLFFLKETIAGVLYTTGILIPATFPYVFDASDLLIVFQFFCVALMNLLAFSWFDYTKDQVHHSPSFATFFGRIATGILIIVLFATATLCAIKHSFSLPYSLVWIIGVCQLVLFIFNKRTSRNETFRLLGDAVFILVPLVYLV